MAKSKEIHSSTILIERIIVHDIPKHKKGEAGVEPKYSEQESELPDGLRNFFKEKVVQSLSSDKSFKICFDPESDSPLSSLVPQLLKANGTNLVEKSKAITKRLFDIQVGYNAAGIIVLIYGKIDSHNACMILKLERDKGAQLTLDEDTKTFNIKEIENLMLTERTKIFKVALLIQRADFNVKYDGFIMDYQIDIKEKKEATTWFMEKFLGCKAFEDPKFTTKNFYNYTRSFIETIDDELERAKYIQDLNSYVQKNTLNLSAKEFAEDYLKTTRRRDDYKGYLDTKNFKLGAFPRDISQIGKQITKFILTFESDIAIVGNKGTFDKKVKLIKQENGQTKAEIVGKIKSMK